MDKTVKILIVICIFLVAGIGLTMGMLIEKNWANTPNNSIENQPTQNTSNTIDKHISTTVQNHTNKNQAHNGEKLFKGQYYIIINKELKYVGESWPVCPFCGSKNTVDVGTKDEGIYWYYFFYCNACGKNFVSSAKSS